MIKVFLTNFEREKMKHAHKNNKNLLKIDNFKCKHKAYILVYSLMSPFCCTLKYICKSIYLL